MNIDFTIDYNNEFELFINKIEINIQHMGVGNLVVVVVSDKELKDIGENLTYVLASKVHTALQTYLSTQTNGQI